MTRDVFLALVLVSWVGILGDVILKKAGQAVIPSWSWCLAGAICYAASAFGWFYILRRVKLATAVGGVYPAIQAITVLAVGFFYFKETPTRLELVGLTLGLISVVLLSQGES